MLDILQDINKQASERVSNAISKLISKEVKVSFVKYEVADAKKIIPLIGSENMVVSIYLPIKVGLKGSSAVILYQKDALILSDLLMKREPGKTTALAEFDKSALKEVGNIILGNYLAILSNTLKTEVIEGMPNYSQGMLGAILEQIAGDTAEEFSKALIVEVQFEIQPLILKGYLYILLEADKINELVSKV